jgi:enoyl-CoA hydratase/carnithine racemase
VSYETMLTQLEDGVFTITLNRPDRLNAFNHQMYLDWMAVLDEVDANDAVRVVVVTGAGRGFCAGADLGKGAATFDAGERAQAFGDKPRRAPRDTGGRVTLRIFQCTKPFIAAVNGPAVGIGATCLLPMDIRLASENARIGFVFSRRGIVPEACSSWFLPRVVGINQAMEWVATGRVFDAAEAKSGGLISQVLPADDLLPRAYELAREIVENTSAVTVALSRQMLWRMLGASHPMDAHRLDSAGVNYMGASKDGHEGVQSFLEKRLPDFPLKPSQDMPPYYPWWDEPEYDEGPVGRGGEG